MTMKARIKAEFRTRGFVGFLKFAATRLCQIREDALYEIRLPKERSSAIQLPAKVVVISRENIGSERTADVERAVLTETNLAYREALKGRDILFAAVDNGRKVVTYGFVLFESFYKRVLGEDADVPMIGNCFTIPEMRGRGLYPGLLAVICDHLADSGYKRAIISCSPDNLASRRGIERAGFLRLRTLRSVVLFSRWIVVQMAIDETASF